MVKGRQYSVYTVYLLLYALITKRSSRDAITIPSCFTEMSSIVIETCNLLYIYWIYMLIYNSAGCQVSKVLHEALNFFIITT